MDLLLEIEPRVGADRPDVLAVSRKLERGVKALQRRLFEHRPRHAHLLLDRRLGSSSISRRGLLALVLEVVPELGVQLRTAGVELLDPLAGRVARQRLDPRVPGRIVEADGERQGPALAQVLDLPDHDLELLIQLRRLSLPVLLQLRQVVGHLQDQSLNVRDLAFTRHDLDPDVFDLGGAVVGLDDVPVQVRDRLDLERVLDPFVLDLARRLDFGVAVVAVWALE